MEACLYHIKKQDNNVFEGYIGVTVDFKRRKYQHFYKLKKGSHKNKKLQETFNNSKIEMFPIMFGSEEYCYKMEEKLRPQYNMGLNFLPGGEFNPGKTMTQRVELGIHPVHVAMKNGDTGNFAFFTKENKEKTSKRNKILFSGTVSVTNKKGKSMRISKKVFDEQKNGSTENWKYVGVGSNEAKLRRGNY